MEKLKNAKEQTVAKIESKIKASTKADFGVSIIQGILSEIPVLGKILSEYIPSARFLRLEDFAKQIADDFKKFSDKIDTEYVSTDNFAFIFEKCFRLAAENHQKDKLEAFRFALINSAIHKEISEFEKEYFLYLVDTFTTVHIRIIKFMIEPSDFLTFEQMNNAYKDGNIAKVFSFVMPDMPLDVVKSAFGDLLDRKLINNYDSIFSMTKSGIPVFSNTITQLGLRFIRFLTMPTTNFSSLSRSTP